MIIKKDIVWAATQCLEGHKKVRMCRWHEEDYVYFDSILGFLFTGDHIRDDNLLNIFLLMTSPYLPYINPDYRDDHSFNGEWELFDEGNKNELIVELKNQFNELESSLNLIDYPLSSWNPMEKVIEKSENIKNILNKL